MCGVKNGVNLSGHSEKAPANMSKRRITTEYLRTRFNRKPPTETRGGFTEYPDVTLNTKYKKKNRHHIALVTRNLIPFELKMPTNKNLIQYLFIVDWWSIFPQYDNKILLILVYQKELFLHKN